MANETNPGASAEASEFDFSGLFATAPAEGAATTDADPAEGGDQNDPSAGNEPADGDDPPADPAQTEAAQLRAQAEESRAMARTLADALARVSGSAAPAAPAEPKPKPAPKFSISPASFTPELQKQLNSEDQTERLQGLATVLTAVAQMVHDRWEKDVGEVYTPRVEEIVQSRLAAYQEQARVEAEWNKTYPFLMSSDQGRAVAGLLVQQVAKEMLEAGMPAAQLRWGPEFKKRFDAKLAPFKRPASGTPAPKAKPGQISRSNGARQGTPGGKDPVADLIWS